MNRLTNPIRTYAWGSRTALASLGRRPVPSAEPEAELWLGAHPAAPSTVSDGDRRIALPDFLAADARATLGPRVLDRFGPRLPYLMKVLAAAQPLSLQAHPDLEQAAAGYAAERAAGVPADESNYTDGNHKPELLVAVEDFHALCGFRDPRQCADELAAVGSSVLAPVVDALRAGSPGEGLRRAVELLMSWPADGRADLVAAASAVPLAARLAELYPGDVGVVVALLLNEVRLRPGEAVFMPAGNLHAYLFGLGVEVMAASDNVLRGGLTPKRVDVPELMRVLRFEVLADPVVRPTPLAPGLQTWATPVADFALARAEIPAGADFDGVRLPGDGPRIICCLRGTARLGTGADAVDLAPGDSVFVEAAEPAVTVTGTGSIVFQATCQS